jgi:hypothetical protein
VHGVIENYFGKEISDPYRYMEESAPEATEWIRAHTFKGGNGRVFCCPLPSRGYTGCGIWMTFGMELRKLRKIGCPTEAVSSTSAH